MSVQRPCAGSHQLYQPDPPPGTPLGVGRLYLRPGKAFPAHRHLVCELHPGLSSKKPRTWLPIAPSRRVVTMPACVPCGACPPFRAGSQAVPGLCGVSRQLDGVAELLWISKRNNIRLDAMKRLSGPSIIGHAFTVCIRTENQNQMRKFSAEAGTQ